MNSSTREERCKNSTFSQLALDNSESLTKAATYNHCRMLFTCFMEHIVFSRWVQALEFNSVNIQTILNAGYFCVLTYVYGYINGLMKKDRIC